jgi:hypothetical protein
MVNEYSFEDNSLKIVGDFCLHKVTDSQIFCSIAVDNEKLEKPFDNSVLRNVHFAVSEDAIKDQTICGSNLVLVFQLNEVAWNVVTSNLPWGIFIDFGIYANRSTVSSGLFIVNE